MHRYLNLLDIKLISDLLPVHQNYNQNYITDGVYS